jgi:hypothetical protein
MARYTCYQCKCYVVNNRTLNGYAIVHQIAKYRITDLAVYIYIYFIIVFQITGYCVRGSFENGRKSNVRC